MNKMVQIIAQAQSRVNQVITKPNKNSKQEILSWNIFKTWKDTVWVIRKQLSPAQFDDDNLDKNG